MKKCFLIFSLFFTAFATQAGLLDKSQTTFLKVEDAFPLSIQLSPDKHQLHVHWNTADGYYLYQDKISVATVEQTLAVTFVQPPEIHQDPYFGAVNVFTKPLDATFSAANAFAPEDRIADF